MTDESSTNLEQPKTLQEALNTIKFLNLAHKQELKRVKESYQKRVDMIHKLESSRKKELEFLSCELQKYEVSLTLRTEAVARQLAEKDDIINSQATTIEQLNLKIKTQEVIIEEMNRKLNLSRAPTVPEINVVHDSNSDSGIAMENDESVKKDQKTESKTTRKCSRRFADSIGFLRRVDFSPMKYKPRDTKKKDEKKSSLEVPDANARNVRQKNNSSRTNENNRPCYDDAVLSDSMLDSISIRNHKLSDSMNNHFSDDGSEDTSEEAFDKVMTRSSFRRSVKANPKYKKINRSKSKLLEQVKLNIVD